MAGRVFFLKYGISGEIDRRRGCIGSRPVDRMANRTPLSVPVRLRCALLIELLNRMPAGKLVGIQFKPANMIPIELSGTEGAAMRLGILLTRIERKENIDQYPISSFEKDRLPAILRHHGGMYLINSLDGYWFSFSYRPFIFNSN